MSYDTGEEERRAKTLELAALCTIADAHFRYAVGEWSLLRGGRWWALYERREALLTELFGPGEPTAASTPAARSGHP